MSLKDKLKHFIFELTTAPKEQRSREYDQLDPKIAPLVAALNQLPTVNTIASCQGHAFGRIEPPYVYFHADPKLATQLNILLRQYYEERLLLHSWELTAMFNGQETLCWTLSSPYYNQRFATTGFYCLGWHRGRVDQDLKVLIDLISIKND
ncbi:hypothetical protein JL857_20760 [Vibrio parahaemolyticus]|uniref:Uncharacterized protein n=1 Tax=Vibrio parahaemolyticus TaxID=670 RepID=A0A9Q3UI40_VIBPH|nr:hypothetical protein [Vibrio parahaemolyticus]MCC3807574.1 hypothetical protein [Vibrio parahaemolyticus]MCI9696463.1 hypothetical protein [Vibrio parahaemolyticus]MCI9711073.1 hypothetical protein [Vibrio parahaemolyticus]MCI9715953.1 hypothetical protein [Vibrio parahaemolyticus]